MDGRLSGFALFGRGQDVTIRERISKIRTKHNLLISLALFVTNSTNTIALKAFQGFLMPLLKLNTTYY